jgi:hypothetical protein
MDHLRGFCGRRFKARLGLSLLPRGPAGVFVFRVGQVGTYRRITRLLIASLIALAGCSSTPVAKQNPVTPLPTPTQVAKPPPTPQRLETLITSDPGGLRIEVGNSYVGTTPVALDLTPWLGPNSPGVTITATSEMGEVKTKFLPPWEPLPQEIVFQMDWPRVIPGTERPIPPSGHN